MVKNFTELIVWRKAHQLMVDTYKLSGLLPKDELYGRISQLRRAVSSIPATVVPRLLPLPCILYESSLTQRIPKNFTICFRLKKHATNTSPNSNGQKGLCAHDVMVYVHGRRAQLCLGVHRAFEMFQ